MTRILVVRRGNVDGIDPERFRCRPKVPVTDLGRWQETKAQDTGGNAVVEVEEGHGASAESGHHQ